MNQIMIKTDYIKLNAFLKFSGAVLTGGEANVEILEGHVFVNNELCLVKGKKLFSGDIVSFQHETYEVLKG